MSPSTRQEAWRGNRTREKNEANKNMLCQERRDRLEKSAQAMEAWQAGMPDSFFFITALEMASWKNTSCKSI